MKLRQSLITMEFPNLASLSVSLRGIFWIYAIKDGSGSSLADLLDLAVLFNKFFNTFKDLYLVYQQEESKYPLERKYSDKENSKGQQ